jgi:2-dehydropantoate 2-reductase
VRFVIFGAGAIGGVAGARLHQSGHDVMLIARGAHHDAIRDRGLTLRTPVEQVTLQLPVAPGPREAALRDGDVVLLATKSQDTAGAIAALRDGAPAGLPIVCLQNGVENERVALRWFADVYAVVVMSPTLHLEPGVVCAYATRTTGTIDVGRYPDGVDERCRAICAALRESRYESEPRADIMRHKHAKLINNLGNVIDVVCGLEADAGELHQRLMEEGREVLRAAGIPHDAGEVSDAQARFDRWGVQPIEGGPRRGSSTWQSAARGGELEIDYLNGEIVLRGRQHGVPTPLNALMALLARQTVREGHEPGWIAPREILQRVGAE